jgi:hypothetical protein
MMGETFSLYPTQFAIKNLTFIRVKAQICMLSRCLSVQIFIMAIDNRDRVPTSMDKVL